MGNKLIGKRIRYNDQERTVVSHKNGKIILDDCVMPIGSQMSLRDYIYGWEDYEVITN